MERSEQIWTPYIEYETELNDAYVRPDTLSPEVNSNMPIEYTNVHAIEEDFESCGALGIEQLPDAADFPPHC